MAAGTISSEKIDLLIYGPSRPILENGFSDQFVLHPFEPSTTSSGSIRPLREDPRRRGDLSHVHADKASLSRFPKLEIVASLASATITSIPLMPANTISLSPIPPMC